MQKNIEKMMKLKELYETYSVEDLEKIAVRAGNYKNRDEEELEAALRVRCWKLNNAFEWTPENKEKLLQLDAKLIECFEKFKAEASTLYYTLLQRIENNDHFLHDFMIEARVIPFVFEQDYEGEITLDSVNEIYGVLSEELNNSVNLSFSIYRESPDETEILYLNREQNWNTDHWFKGQFDEHFISQAIHDLYDHTDWSFPDILQINYLDVNLNVNYEHFVEFVEFK
ncbi:MAG: hypothetical protein LBN95_07460 [Prevotellaceae bacterium]|jgi:hypothetical protein|nr:hypothetical protein [Prevotellaceae bacterium]